MKCLNKMYKLLNKMLKHIMNNKMLINYAYPF